MGLFSNYLNAINETMPLYPGSKATVEAAAAGERVVQAYSSSFNNLRSLNDIDSPNYGGYEMSLPEFVRSVNTISPSGGKNGVGFYLVVGLVILLLAAFLKD